MIFSAVYYNQKGSRSLPSNLFVALCMCFMLVFVLQPKDSWKTELKEFSNKNGYDLNRNGESGPVLLDVLEGFLKFEVCGCFALFTRFGM